MKSKYYNISIKKYIQSLLKMNRESLGNLLLENSELTFLVGAGCSVDEPSCLATGREMIDSIIEHSCIKSEVENLMRLNHQNLYRFEAVIEIFQNNCDPNLLILDYFGLCNVPNFQHFYLANMLLKGNHIITVNFDNLLESALDLLKVSSDKIIPVINKEDFLNFLFPNELIRQGKFPIYKLHGSLTNYTKSIDTKNSLKATIKSLGKIKRTWGEFLIDSYKRPLFKHILDNRILVVIGYSGNDDFDIIPSLKLIKSIKKIIWLNYTIKEDVTLDISEITEDSIDTDGLTFLLKNIKASTKVKELIRVDGNISLFISEILFKAENKASIDKIKLEKYNVTFDTWLKQNFQLIEDHTRMYITYLLYLMISDQKKTIEIGRKLLEIACLSKDKNLAIDAFHAIGSSYFEIGYLKKAERYINLALELLKYHKNNKLRAMVINSKGLIYRRLELFDEAKEAFDEAYEISKYSGDFVDKSTFLNNLADSMIVSDNLEEAENILKKIKKLDIKSGSLTSMAHHLNNLARIKYLKNEMDESIKLLLKALKISEGLNNIRKEIEIKTNLGSVYQKKNDIYNSARWYLESFNQLKNIEYYDGEIELYNNWAHFFLKIGDLIFALYNLENVSMIIRRIKRRNTPFSIILKHDIEKIITNLESNGFRIEIIEDQILVKN